MLLGGVAQGAVPVSFAISGSQFQISASQLDGTGFSQYAGVTKDTEGKQHQVAIANINNATLTNLCQSWSPTPRSARWACKITAGGGGKPVVAQRLQIGMTDLKGDATFNNIRIGVDASTVNTAAKGIAGDFAQDADTVIDHQPAADRLEHPGLRLHAHRHARGADGRLQGMLLRDDASMTDEENGRKAPRRDRRGAADPSLHPVHGDASGETDAHPASAAVASSAAPPPSGGFRHWRRRRPFVGGLLVALGGVEMFFSGQLDIGNLHVQLGIEGLQATIIPIALLLLGILAIAMPAHRIFYGVIALVVAIYSLIGVNLGGFIVGMLLSSVGAVLVVAWMGARTPAAETPEIVP